MSWNQDYGNYDDSYGQYGGQQHDQYAGQQQQQQQDQYGQYDQSQGHQGQGGYYNPNDYGQPQQTNTAYRRSVSWPLSDPEVIF